jgi:hypothetical protein
MRGYIVVSSEEGLGTHSYSYFILRRRAVDCFPNSFEVEQFGLAAARPSILARTIPCLTLVFFPGVWLSVVEVNDA